MRKWRKRANRVICDVVAEAMRENPRMSEKELRQRISDAYPFGERKYHPYKIWLSEVKNWLGGVAQPIDEDHSTLPLFAEVDP